MRGAATGCRELRQNIRRHQLYFVSSQWKRQRGARALPAAGAAASPGNGRRCVIPPCKHGHVGSGLGQWAASSGGWWPMRKGKGWAQGEGRG